MRVLGLARLLRAVCRRWLGGLIVVDDVQLSVFTGELELVDCELDGPKLTRLLAPQTSESPLFMHLTDVTPKGVRSAVDQIVASGGGCTAAGAQTLIFDFML